MTDTHDHPNRGFNTRLSHGGRAGSRHGFVNPPVTRGSTVLFPNMAARRDSFAHRYDQATIYGVMGTPTHHALEDLIAEIEGGTRCQIVSSGLAACTTPLLGYLDAGDHLLMPDSVYAPVRSFCDAMLRRLGVETEYYAPELDQAGFAALLRPNTRVAYTESPGSHSFDMQDIPGIARAVQAHNAATGSARPAVVMLDNTWGIHHFQPFRHGVDVSIQALTKYPVGHSDVLLGSITVADDAHWRLVRDAALQTGQYASPDDCWLALRGLRTLGVRLRRQMQTGLEIAYWLQSRPEVARVLHPALPGAPGHDIWKRDFTGAPSLFGVEFAPRYRPEDTHRLVETLQLFGIGASWGGYESLALPTTNFITRTAGTFECAGPVVRFHIGLEDGEDLIRDLEQALHAMNEGAAT